MIKINKNIPDVDKGTWVTFPDDPEVKILIRPFSLFSMTKLPASNEDFSQYWDAFNFCLMDWEGIVDKKNKKIECNEESRKFIFDFDQDLFIFIITESAKMREELITKEEVKNSQTSQPGQETKQEK